MKKHASAVKPLAPMEAAVGDVLVALCGYARSEGKHICGKNACDLNDWQVVRKRVQGLWYLAQLHLLRQYAEVPPAETLARATLAHLEQQLALVEAAEAEAGPCRGCPSWVPCQGRTNNQLREAG